MSSRLDLWKLSNGDELLQKALSLFTSDQLKQFAEWKQSEMEERVKLQINEWRWNRDELDVMREPNWLTEFVRENAKRLHEFCFVENDTVTREILGDYIDKSIRSKLGRVPKGPHVSENCFEIDDDTRDTSSDDSDKYFISVKSGKSVEDADKDTDKESEDE